MTIEAPRRPDAILPRDFANWKVITLATLPAIQEAMERGELEPMLMALPFADYNELVAYVRFDFKVYVQQSEAYQDEVEKRINDAKGRSASPYQTSATAPPEPRKD